MAKSQAVTVQGMNQLRRALKQLGDDLADLKAAHRSAAELVMRRAAGTLPKRTGALAASLRVGSGAASSLLREGKASVPYAGPVEFGGYPRGRPFIREGRYLFPAAKASIPQVEAIYEAAIEAEAAKF